MNKKLLILSTLLFSYQIKSEDIFALVQQKNYQEVERLLDDSAVNVNQSNIIDDTPLTVAIKNNDIPMVYLLLKRGANANHVNFRSRKTPLMLAVEMGNPIIVEKLLELQVDINKVDRSGEDALIKAINKNNNQLVDLLVRYGARLQCSQVQGFDLFRKALENEDPYMLWNLVAAGLNISEVYNLEFLNTWHEEFKIIKPRKPRNLSDRIGFMLFLLKQELDKIISGLQENYADIVLFRMLEGVDRYQENRFIEPILKSFVSEYANQKLKEFGASSDEGKRAQKILDNINQIDSSSSGAAASSSS